jgi:hypothetical protein
MEKSKNKRSVINFIPLFFLFIYLIVNFFSNNEIDKFFNYTILSFSIISSLIIILSKKENFLKNKRKIIMLAIAILLTFFFTFYNSLK